MRIKKLMSVLVLTLLISVSHGGVVFSQNILNGVCAGNSDAQVCKTPAGGNDPLFGSDGILATVVEILFIVVGIASVIMLIVGGLRYIMSSGDPNSVTSAKNTILYAIIGIVVAVSARAILSFVLKRL